MFPRCIFADTRYDLGQALKIGGHLQFQSALLELSKLQRQIGALDLLKLGSSMHDKFELHEDDCSLVKVEGRPCITDIKGLFSDLVCLLGSCNPFIRHSAARALLVLLQHLEEIPSLWVFSVNKLFTSLMVFFNNGEETGTEILTKIPSDLLFISEHLDGTQQQKWSYIVCVLQMLHDSFRSCKHGGEAKLMIFLTIFEPSIREFLAAFKSRFQQNFDEDKNEERDVALGVLLRLLCSVTHSNGVRLDVVEPDILNRILEYINGFVSDFSNYCLNGGHFLPHYLRQKFLLLLFRLSERFAESPILGITCTNVLKPHLGVLCGSLFLRKEETTGSIRQSPFAYCLIQKEPKQGSSSSRHPEKYAVFLIFKVIVTTKIASCKKSSHAVSFANEYHNDQREEWFFYWLASQVNSMVDMSMFCTNEVANSFTWSFLEIFVDEDTLLLDMLLILLDVSSLQIFQGIIQTHCEAFQVSQSLLIEIFKPVRLFAVFISLVSYDHSVLLDFLISKDVSVRCLEYFVRSIRIVNNTWPDFLSLSHTRSMEDVFCDASGMQKLQLKYQYHSVYIEEVVDCLLSLKSAIERLHLKRAFPYNPSPLLKLLNSFEQLWLQKKA